MYWNVHSPIMVVNKSLSLYNYYRNNLYKMFVIEVLLKDGVSYHTRQSQTCFIVISTNSL